MKIHTNELIAADFYAAASIARADITVFDQKGSRSRTTAYEVKLGGDSPYRPMGGGVNGEFAASWDQWGIFLAELFKADDSVATPTYPTAEHFHAVTESRFETLRHGEGDYETRHKWQGHGGMQLCERCSATFIWDIPTPKIAKHVPGTLTDSELQIQHAIDYDSPNAGELAEASLW